MILSGKEIKKRQRGDIIIAPFSEKQLNPNSYNLRLCDKLIVYDEKTLDIKKKNIFKEIKISKNGIILYPGKLYLGRTSEYTETNNLVPMIEGRSSLARLGLNIHISAGFGDVGYKGFWTLELSCVQPIIIYPGIEICQIYYHTILGGINNYVGKYQKNNGIQTSKMWKEF